MAGPTAGVGGVGGHPPEVVLDTPDTPTIAALVDRLNTMDLGRRFEAGDTLKNVVVKTREPGGDDWQLLIVGVPGDREVDMKRLAGQLEPTEVASADAGDLDAFPGLVRGYIGPQAFGELGVRYLVDPLVVDRSAWVTGANQPGRHAMNVVRGRDFVPDGEIGAVEVRHGDRCARCGGPLSISRGIELGHVFQLGRKYAEAFGLEVSGPDGRAVTVTMGSYGIGVSRAVAALAEQLSDDLGLRWPAVVAPAAVHLVAVGKGAQPFEVASALAAELDGLGVGVLYEDRADTSPGAKFADAELLGMPVIVTVGRGLAQGVVEVRDRATNERRNFPVGEVVAELRDWCSAASVGLVRR